MAIYWSNARHGFFDDAIHGARRVPVIDLVKFDQERKKVWREAEDSPDAARAASAKLAALLSNPPMIEIDNPDCQLPDDAVEISAEEHAELMAELAKGRILLVDDDGQPRAADRIATVEEQLAVIRKRQRAELASTDWTQLPDALTAAKRKAWAAHRQLLRDLPDLVEKAIADGKPVDSVEWPEAPA